MLLTMQEYPIGKKMSNFTSDTQSADAALPRLMATLKHCQRNSAARRSPVTATIRRPSRRASKKSH
jgi:hypothetical protein